MQLHADLDPNILPTPFSSYHIWVCGKFLIISMNILISINIIFSIFTQIFRIMNIRDFPMVFLTFIIFVSCTPRQKKIDRYMKEGIKKILNCDNKAAIEDFTKVIDLQPENYQAYYYRANAKFNRRDAKNALADYNKSIEMKPDFADAFYNRALCKQFLNDKDGACNDWNKAAALGRTNVKDLLNICR